MKRYLIVLTLCVLVLGGLFAVERDPSHVVTRKPNIAEIVWMEKIRDVGGEAAYKELSILIAPLEPQPQHEEAHTFGAALYEVLGTEGLRICDSKFAFACYHEFLGRAISDLGLSSVVALNQACFDSLQDSPLSCQHGIGHGVVAYLGYDEKALSRSLEICKNLPYSDPIGGCYGGVFMEYNMQIMLGEDGKLRELVGAEWLSPCDTLEDAYKPACAFWQTQWWNQVRIEQGHTDKKENFTFMGEQCRRYGSASLSRTCFEGIGNITPPEADFNPIKARGLCEAVSNDREHQLYCKSFAANSITLGGAGRKGDGLVVCDGLRGNDRTHCEAYAQNKSNILTPLAR